MMNNLSVGLAIKSGINLVGWKASFENLGSMKLLWGKNVGEASFVSRDGFLPSVSRALPGASHNPSHLPVSLQGRKQPSFFTKWIKIESDNSNFPKWTWRKVFNLKIGFLSRRCQSNMFLESSKASIKNYLRGVIVSRKLFKDLTNWLRS